MTKSAETAVTPFQEAGTQGQPYRERRRPDLNRRSGFCRPLPCHLATSP
jgi:hypothetical protein